VDAARAKGPDEKFCTECGEVIRARAAICPKCGVPQPVAGNTDALGFQLAPNGKSKLAAGLFGIFLGAIGVHKFYLGQIGWGVVYVLFCWTLIPAIAGMIEGILYLAMSDAEFAARYGAVRPA
jgi:TM2 domain-containing membrane protein YozV